MSGAQKGVVFFFARIPAVEGLPQRLRFPMFSYVQGYPYVVLTAEDILCACCNNWAQMD